MFSLGQWFKQIEQRKIAVSQKRGFETAISMLLKEGKTPRDLENLYDTSSTFNEGRIARAFDQGMKEGVDKMVQVGAVIDDRI